MDEFKTFKPLLQAIKREYELMLTHNRESIRRLEPLKQMLITTTEKCQRKIDEIKNTDKPGIESCAASAAGLGCLFNL